MTWLAKNHEPQGPEPGATARGGTTFSKTFFESSRIVTGPSFVSSACIMARNTPVLTRPAVSLLMPCLVVFWALPDPSVAGKSEEFRFLILRSESFSLRVHAARSWRMCWID